MYTKVGARQGAKSALRKPLRLREGARALIYLSKEFATPLNTNIDNSFPTQGLKCAWVSGNCVTATCQPLTHYHWRAPVSWLTAPCVIISRSGGSPPVACTLPSSPAVARHPRLEGKGSPGLRGLEPTRALQVRRGSLDEGLTTSTTVQCWCGSPSRSTARAPRCPRRR